MSVTIANAQQESITATIDAFPYQHKSEATASIIAMQSWQKKEWKQLVKLLNDDSLKLKSSYAMNAFVGAIPFAGGTVYKNFLHQRDIRNTSKTFTLVEEHPDSINDGWFLPVLSDTDTVDWQDLPASYHNGCGCMTFADGHSEIHKWLDTSTLKPITKIYRRGLPFGPAPPARDLAWTIEHLSPQ